LTGNIRFIHPEGLAPSPSYTHVVEVWGGRTVYISGQIALNAQGQLVGAGDFEAQARQVFGNLALALASAGLTFGHVGTWSGWACT
jgi:enamine deaminase RidA (YjgF/YER057c/UK114 family)